MKKIIIPIFLMGFITVSAFADDIVSDNIINDEIEKTNTEPVITNKTCAVNIFANTLSKNSSAVLESDTEYIIQGWVRTNFEQPNVIQEVLKCPEIAELNDGDTIQFPRIEYKFPQGREIKIDYTTSVDILKKRLELRNKKSIPETNPNPRIGAPDDSAIWTNTDPAWYGILVVQHGALDKFIGPDKNNTISLKYIEQNIDKIYPSGAMCTSKSALANDNEIINLATKKTVNMEDDSNDYYVAGDVNLQWITWGEVALDVAITVATVGTGTAVLGTTKAVRASKTAKNLIVVMKDLEKSEKVAEYIKLTRNISKTTEELKNLDRVKDAAQYASKSDDLKKLSQTAKELEKIEDVTKYKNAASGFEDVMKLRRGLKSMKLKQPGNVITRAWRAFKVANTGGKTLDRGAKAARAGMKSAKILDRLFLSTLKNIGKLGKIQEATGILYGAMKFAGDMYDWTETSTGEFTNNIEFKPLGLLSADDLQGQENIINHGMWLMWIGASVNPADDDAAYLTAFDFATKFYQDMEEVQSEKGTQCSVDIFVVRPVLRNPDSPDAQLYYLIMNDVPWTSAGK